MIVYTIQVIESKPTISENSKYRISFSGDTLDDCKQKAEAHLSECPAGTQYLYLQTRQEQPGYTKA